MKKQKELILVLAMLLFISIIPLKVAEASPERIEVFVHGKWLAMDVDPIIKADRTFIPVRFIAEALECQVDYSKSANTVHIKKPGIELTLPIGGDKAEVNGKRVKLDAASFIEKDRTFVPLRFIAESFNEEVQWDAKNRNVLVGEAEGGESLVNSHTYTNEKYKYTLQFPNHWKEDAIFEEKDGELTVYEKTSYDAMKGGGLFTISLREEPASVIVPGLILEYRDGKYLEVIFPSDVQFMPETQEAYEKMFQEGQKVLKTFIKNDTL